MRHTKNSSLGDPARFGPAESDGGGAVVVGVGKLERRAGLDTMRAGTRGFRAPEVLLCVKDQSPAIDVWSVGAILITILSGRSPFFAASSDIDNLCEIGALFGMQSAATSTSFRAWCSRILRSTTLHAPCDVLYLGTVVTRMLTGACNPML